MFSETMTPLWGCKSGEMMLKNSFKLFILSLLVFSCKGKKTETEPATLFKLKSADHTGIQFSNDLINSDALNIVEYLYYYNGGGVAVGDINNDGLDDIYFSGNQQSDRLYLNKGNLHFEDITVNAGIIQDASWSSGVVIADINGDGWEDIYVCKVALLSADEKVHNLLYINNGDGTFKEMSEAYGLNFRGLSTHVVFLDYDMDGDPDMYLLNHNIHSINSYGNIDKRRQKDLYAGDRLYENRLREEGKFVDVTDAAGIYSSPLGYGLAVTSADVNNDGWPDIYVGNDFHENDYLYINNGNKTFTESIKNIIPHSTQFSMGVDIADITNDGIYDIFTTDMMPYDPEVTLVSAGEDSDQVKLVKKDFGFESQKARNHFQSGQKDGTFSDIACMTGTFATDWSWSVLIQDYDNDTRPDIFITNGIVRRPNDLDYINFLNELDNKNPDAVKDRNQKLIERMPSQPLKNILFKQNDNSVYEKQYVGNASFSTGAAYADFDNDGDLDLVVNNINEKASIYENQTSGKNYIAFDLRGITNHTNTIGTAIHVYAEGQVYKKSLQPTRGFMSSVTKSIHFGLDSMTSVDSVLIIWPDGYYQVANNMAVNSKQLIQRTEDLRKFEREKQKQPMTASVLPMQHTDNKYQDQNYEKLIPERLSYEGPAFIYADLNGDGIEDLYLGGGRNQAAQLFLGASNGSFNKKVNPDFEQDAGYEDVHAALIDFDGDGDKDLYVVSGGSDNKELDKILEDRLYLNNGNGIFKRLPLSLPHTNGSCVAVADFDRDGFEDLFIGARSIPGSYGLSPYSFVLRNTNGMGIEIALKERFGMVKDAKWADIDGDGDMDLIMCGDWMDITLLENEGAGMLTEKTMAYGLSGKSGLWSTLALADLNGDGILDIIAGNAGTNLKWKASDSLPVKMYVGDFDGNGDAEPLIFYHYFSRYIPFAPMTTLITQLPVLRKKFTTYSSFKAVSDISDLFENYLEKLVEQKSLNELRSMIFLSEGKRYKTVPLDMNEQMGDICDINIDSNNNVYYIGGSRDYVSEMGAPSANTGRFLSGFDPITGRFSQSVRLPLPVSASPRRLIAGKNGRYFIATNGGYIYVLQNNAYVLPSDRLQ